MWGTIEMPLANLWNQYLMAVARTLVKVLSKELCYYYQTLVQNQSPINKAACLVSFISFSSFSNFQWFSILLPWISLHCHLHTIRQDSVLLSGHNKCQQDISLLTRGPGVLGGVQLKTAILDGYSIDWAASKHAAARCFFYYSRPLNWTSKLVWNGKAACLFCQTISPAETFLRLLLQSHFCSFPLFQIVGWWNSTDISVR